MITIKASQKIFTYAEVAKLTGICEDLLARFDGYHWFNSSQFLQSSTLKNSDAMQRLRSPEDFLSSLWCEQPELQKHPYKWDAQAKNNHQHRNHQRTGAASSRRHVSSRTQ